MGRSQGTAKTGGRKKGTPNKRSLELAETLDYLGRNPVDELFALIPQLQAKEQAQILLGFLPYLYPKRKSLDLTVQEQVPNPIAAMPREERLQKLQRYTKLLLQLNGAQAMLQPGLTVEQFVATIFDEKSRNQWLVPEDEEPEEYAESETDGAS